jgi:bifunctional DNA-binding transcriptional regulator/antitoxin component of YhaV-PrlF toxin-antitoxin module
MATTEVRVRAYRVSRRGTRGFSVTLPPAWVEDVNLRHGDLVEVYRDNRGRLIIARAAEGEKR